MHGRILMKLITYYHLPQLLITTSEWRDYTVKVMGQRSRSQTTLQTEE